MKKFMLFVLSLLLLLSLFGCQKHSEDDTEVKKYEPNTWDGSVAEAFEGGEGTEESPYLIASGAQLAYLAKSVNDGSSYENKYISLLCDIDLNNVEWTPIGNGELAFGGNFNGNSHIIKNLKISNVNKFSSVVGDLTTYNGFSGLFGFCENVSLSNLSIDNAAISISNVDEFGSLYIGTLAAKIETQSLSKVENIKIDNTVITIDNSKTTDPKKGSTSMGIGGLIGLLKSEKASTKTSINSVQCKDISVSYGENYLEYNFIGGIVGYVTNYNDFECSDFLSQLNTEAPPYRSCTFHFGAFGQIYRASGNINLSNGFSKLSLDKNDQGKYGEIHDHQANAIIGKEIGSYDKDVYNFENLFGYIETTENSVVEKTYNLYTIHEESAEINETNCFGCESLPENHGFDNKIWNLDDLSNPTLH